jgi:hypothetical protein
VGFVVGEVALGKICLGAHNVSLAAFVEGFSETCIFSWLEQVMFSGGINTYISAD